jgi:hypothetical protein
LQAWTPSSSLAAWTGPSCTPSARLLTAASTGAWTLMRVKRVLGGRRCPRAQLGRRVREQANSGRPGPVAKGDPEKPQTLAAPPTRSHLPARERHDSSRGRDPRQPGAVGSPWIVEGEQLEACRSRWRTVASNNYWTLPGAVVKWGAGDGPSEIPRRCTLGRSPLLSSCAAGAHLLFRGPSPTGEPRQGLAAEL